MAKINDTIVKHILDATHIEDVVGKFVELKKRGPRYLGLCPFHDDRHIGNFSVYPKGNCYKCFACGAKGDAVTFLMESQKMSFADAIRWLGKQVGIDVDGRNVDLDIKAYEPPPPLPTLFLPEQMVAATEVRTTHNNLIAWLNGLPWSSRQRERIDEVLAAYHVGTSKRGDAIFWQIDENGGVRDGKMMKYLPDGHRDKSTPYSINWVSRRLFKNGYFDEDKWEPRRCLFGLHLLTRYPIAEVHVVESEKTALFCAIYFGDPERHLWLATAGKGNLTKHILQPLIDARRVVALHPDKDGVEDWEARRKDIGYKYAYVNNSVLTLQWQPQDGEKADVADWKFKVLPVGGWGMPEQLTTEPRLNDNPENIKQWLTVGRNDIEWPATKEKIKEIFKNRGGVTNRTAQNDNLKVALNRRFIIEQPKDTWAKGQNYVRYILNPEVIPNDEPFGPEREEVPF